MSLALSRAVPVDGDLVGIIDIDGVLAVDNGLSRGFRRDSVDADVVDAGPPIDGLLECRRWYSDAVDGMGRRWYGRRWAGRRWSEVAR